MLRQLGKQGAGCRLNSAAEIKGIVDFLGLLIELFLQSAAEAVKDNGPDWATVFADRNASQVMS